MIKKEKMSRLVFEQKLWDVVGTDFSVGVGLFDTNFSIADQRLKVAIILHGKEPDKSLAVELSGIRLHADAKNIDYLFNCALRISKFAPCGITIGSADTTEREVFDCFAESQNILLDYYDVSAFVGDDITSRILLKSKNVEGAVLSTREDGQLEFEMGETHIMFGGPESSAITHNAVMAMQKESIKWARKNKAVDTPDGIVMSTVEKGDVEDDE